VRVRDVLAVLVGLGVLGVVGYGGWWWLSDTLTDDDGDTSDDPLRAAIEEYVTAWEQGDDLTMAALVRGDLPEDFEDVHAQMIEGLRASALEITVGDVDGSVEGRAVAPLTLNVTVPIAQEPISWDTELRMVRDRGQWGVEWSLSTVHPELRPTWFFDSEIEDVERAPILAVDGTELAGDGRLMSLGFQPSRVLDEDRVIAAFERAFPGTEERVERELNRDDLVDSWYYPIVTVTEQRAQEAWEELRGTAGILEPRRVQGQARALLDDGFAQHIVGIVAQPTAEEIEELGDDYEDGMVVGRYGLEAILEDQLVGGQRYRAGLRESEDGEFRTVLGEGQEEGSGPVETTIDVAVQRAAENVLRGIEEPAAIVVVDGTDGGIRAAASRSLASVEAGFGPVRPGLSEQSPSIPHWTRMKGRIAHASRGSECEQPINGAFRMKRTTSYLCAVAMAVSTMGFGVVGANAQPMPVPTQVQAPAAEGNVINVRSHRADRRAAWRERRGFERRGWKMRQVSRQSMSSSPPIMSRARCWRRPFLDLWRSIGRMRASGCWTTGGGHGFATCVSPREPAISTGRTTRGRKPAISIMA
jgi:hypothetical protein